MELAQPHRLFRTPYALNFQAALLFLITILPVLLVVGWFNHQYVRAALEEQINLDTRARTTEIEERFANVLLRELERLMTLGQSPTLPGLAHPVAGAAARAAAQQAYERATQVEAIREQYVTNAAGQVLKRFREEYPNRAVVLLADPQGGLESVTTPSWPYWDLSKQPWWPDLAHQRATALSISRPMEVKGYGTLLFLAVPLLDETAQPVGVIAVGLKFNALTGPILAADHRADTTMLLATSDGQILYSLPPWADKQLPTSWAPALHAVGPESNVFDAHLVGYAPIQVSEGYTLDSISSIRALNRLNWVVLSATPTATAFAAIDGQLGLLLLGTGATAVVVVLIALIAVGWLVTRPLRHIRAVIMDVDQHGLSPAMLTQAQTHLPHSRNEIGQLGAHFGRMLEGLVSLTQEREQIYARQQTTVSSLRTAAAELSRAAAEQQAIAASTSEVLHRVLAAFQALDAAATTIAGHARDVAGQATALKEQHCAGESAVLTTRAALAELQHTAQFLEQGTQRLVEDTDSAGTLIEKANEIAGTTHLLSLNAYIEAVGAGQYGARFGVIATEVRDLAAAAAQAASSIEGTLAHMAEQTQTTAQQTHQARLAVDNGTAQMDVLIELMQVLLQSSDQLAVAAERIHQHSDTQRSHSSEVHVNSNQLARAMEQVLAASEHIAAQAQELLHLAGDLDRIQQPLPTTDSPANRVEFHPLPAPAF